MRIPFARGRKNTDHDPFQGAESPHQHQTHPIGTNDIQQSPWGDHKGTSKQRRNTTVPLDQSFTIDIIGVKVQTGSGNKSLKVLDYSKDTLLKKSVVTVRNTV